jgi:predicted DNA-binding ribbon-helix-helix protein
MNTNKKVATTVKIESSLYDDFKVLGIRHKITLQALIERSIYKYVNDKSYREDINNFNLPVIQDPISTEAILVVSSSLS